MARIAVVGGGISGLAACVALAREGHDLVLFERDPSEPVADVHAAFEADRRGAPQVRHSHAFLALLRNLLRDEYPDVLASLYEAGATDLPFADGVPPTVVDFAPEPGDEDLSMLACRRTTFEWVLRRTANAEGRLTVHGGSEVTGLVVEGTTSDGVPVVRGVRLSDGTEQRFDLTVVGNGRRGALPEWLAAAGCGEVPEIVDDSGIVYFSRFYRLKPGQELPPRTGPIGGDLGYVKYGVFAGDNGTFSITLAAATDDTELRRLLDDDETFDRCARSLVFTAPYLDGRAEPLNSVQKIAGLISRWRDYVVDGRPLAVGVVPVGDALVATNPLYGRGCAMGFWAAHLLRTTIAAHGDDLVSAVPAFHAAVAANLKPWVESTMRTDAEARRVAAAILRGEDPDDPSDPSAMQRSILRDGLRPAMRSDAVVLRAFMRNFNLLTPPDTVVKDAEVMGRVLQAWQERDSRPPEPMLGPGRDPMLAILRGEAA